MSGQAYSSRAIAEVVTVGIVGALLVLIWRSMFLAPAWLTLAALVLLSNGLEEPEEAVVLRNELGLSTILLGRSLWSWYTVTAIIVLFALSVGTTALALPLALNNVNGGLVPLGLSPSELELIPYIKEFVVAPVVLGVVVLHDVYRIFRVLLSLRHRGDDKRCRALHRILSNMVLSTLTRMLIMETAAVAAYIILLIILGGKELAGMVYVDAALEISVTSPDILAIDSLLSIIVAMLAAIILLFLFSIHSVRRTEKAY